MSYEAMGGGDWLEWFHGNAYDEYFERQGGDFGTGLVWAQGMPKNYQWMLLGDKSFLKEMGASLNGAFEKMDRGEYISPDIYNTGPPPDSIEELQNQLDRLGASKLTEDQKNFVQQKSVYRFIVNQLMGAGTDEIIRETQKQLGDAAIAGNKSPVFLDYGENLYQDDWMGGGNVQVDQGYLKDLTKELQDADEWMRRDAPAPEQPQDPWGADFVANEEVPVPDAVPDPAP